MSLRPLMLSLWVSMLLACSPENRAVFESGDHAASDLGAPPPDLGMSVPCSIGAGRCEGDDSYFCLEDGTVVSEYCDPVQGSSCDAETHRCTGPCARSRLGPSYVGCEYYPTVTANAIYNIGTFDFAVAVSNTALLPAEVQIEGGELTSPIKFVVAPMSVQVQPLPWVMSLAFGAETPPTSALVHNGAYRLRTTQPVTVYQFNALECIVNGHPSYSNDASLLLPENALGTAYRTVGWPAQGLTGVSPGLLAITATQDGTAVSLTAAANTVASNGAPAYVKGVPTTLNLDRGDVLQVFNQISGDDFTGSFIQTSQPVQVIAGHFCTLIPDRSFACDHLEDALFPIQTLGLRYFVTAPALPALPNGKVEWVRIVATQSDTHLTFDPPQSGATALQNPGDFIELPRNAGDFIVSADHKVIIAQFMASQNEGGDSGDPAMALAVPIEQYRRDYLFHAPLSYQTNYANVIAPLGAKITLDGSALAGFTGIGGTGYGVVRQQLGTGNNGNHSMSGDQPFGLTVYGYGLYTSYWYPGGLDLNQIP